MRHHCFGVDYVRLADQRHGELFVTRYGWPVLESLLPDHWYEDHLYTKRGQRLSEGTGTVYRVESPHQRLGTVPLVMKYSRFAQDVPLCVSSEFLREFVSHEAIENARFNGPFEEFGHLIAVRDQSHHPELPRIRTKRPLAIYVPWHREQLWRLNRSHSSFRLHDLAQNRDQAKQPEDQRIALDIHRDYLLLFGWVAGQNAREMHERDLISEEQMRQLTRRAKDDLLDHNYVMLDLKPQHLILRQCPDTRRLLERHGEITYALVDFELLQPAPS
jgi:hypothetical protein